MACRRPTPAELGLDVTIAIVAMTISWEIFICVSDRMVSHDDQMAAADNAVIKIWRCRGAGALLIPPMI